MASKAGSVSTVLNPRSPVRLFREVGSVIRGCKFAGLLKAAAEDKIALSSTLDLLSRLRLENCYRDLYIAREPYIKMSYSSLVGENSRLKRPLDRAIQASHETGFAHHRRQRHQYQSNHQAFGKCPKAALDQENGLIYYRYLALFTNNQLRMQHFVTITKFFLILFAGCFSLLTYDLLKWVHIQRISNRMSVSPISDEIPFTQDCDRVTPVIG